MQDRLKDVHEIQTCCDTLAAILGDGSDATHGAAQSVVATAVPCTSS